MTAGDGNGLERKEELEDNGDCGIDTPGKQKSGVWRKLVLGKFTVPQSGLALRRYTRNHRENGANIETKAEPKAGRGWRQAHGISHLGRSRSHRELRKAFAGGGTFIAVDHESAITTAKSANRTFHLDYFIYETASSVDSGTIRFIDDSDAAVIYSSKGWLSSTNGTNDVKNTHHTSNLNGAWVVVPFEGSDVLSGNNISLSLTTTNAPVNNVLSTFGASALVDGQQAVFVPQPGLPFTLWLSNTLSSGSHQLNLTVSDVHPIEIDYFMVTGSTAPSSVPGAPPAPSTSAQASTRKNLPVPIIVGAVVGAIIILVLAATCVFLWRRSHASVDQRYGGSWLGRWVTRAQIGRESAVLPRPFRLSFRTRRNTQASPPPYRLKYSDGP
ncbi:hypothetical protein R3P38DRAFT_3360157 [Favolaschia claudopus]|uniref:Transmembrane protein n=1 Tax=Favolaschia claudopus TaxID=2862362 RepID=A0AAW0B1L5_9AGAR